MFNFFRQPPYKPNMKLISYLFACLLLLCSCGQNESTDTFNEKAIREEVRQTLKDYYDDISVSGLTAEFKYLDSSDQFYWVPPGFKSAISYDSVATILRQNAPKYSSVKNTFDTLSVYALSYKLATYTGRLRSSMTDTNGITVQIKMLETGVLLKRRNGWKLLCGQTGILND